MAAVLLLTAYGVLIIRSSFTGAPAFSSLPGLQVQWAAIGMVILLFLDSIDYRILTSIHWYIFGLLSLSLLLVLIIGVSIAGIGAQRWLQIPGINFFLQQSEFGLIFIGVSLAQFLANRQHQIHRFSNTIGTLIYIGIPTGLIFLQPDLGMSIVYVIVWFAIIWLAGLPLSHFVILTVVGVASVIIVYPNLQDYQKERITTFVDPEAADEDDVFNINQAEISIGSGGWLGKGYGQGTQSQLGFLRIQHTDFIFSVIVEEMGFVFGALVVLGLMIFILMRILRVASLTPDPAGKYICAGIAAVLFFQTLVSVGMNVRILPVTGLTLPFVSYGGSSLITLFIAIGIVQSVLMRHRRQEFG
jgi:rod shape determining protein RodA